MEILARSLLKYSTMLSSIVSPLVGSAEVFGGVELFDTYEVMDLYLLLEEVFLEVVAFPYLLCAC